MVAAKKKTQEVTDTEQRHRTKCTTEVTICPLDGIFYPYKGANLFLSLNKLQNFTLSNEFYFAGQKIRAMEAQFAALKWQIYIETCF